MPQWAAKVCVQPIEALAPADTMPIALLGGLPYTTLTVPRCRSRSCRPDPVAPVTQPVPNERYRQLTARPQQRP